MHRRIIAQDESLARAYAEIARRVKRAMSRRPSANIEQLIRAELRRTFAARQAIMVDSIDELAALGSDAHIAEVRSVLGNTAAARIARSAFDSPAAAIVRGNLTPGGVGLPVRLRNMDKEILSQITEAAGAARRAGDSAIQAANRFMRVGGDELQNELPKYIAELRDALRGGDVDEMRAATADFIRISRQRGSVAGSQFTIRGANKKLLSRLTRAQAADRDALFDDWLQRRALQRARTIARTEGVRSFNEAYVRRSESNPDVEALKYNLSSSHPEPDICDLYANQGPDGFGPGVYDKGNAPSLPAHPHCLTSGHQIQTAAGLKNIEDIRVGDLVLTHRGRMRRVLRLSRRKVSTQGFLVETQHGSLKLTSEHPLLTRDGWKPANHLEQGSLVAVFGDAQHTPSEVSVHKVPVWIDEEVFNFSVDEDESYVANNIVTHNCLCFFTSVLTKPDGSTSVEVQQPVTAADWLAGQSRAAQRSILGPTRTEIFQRKPSAVVSERGQIATVKRAQRART